MASAGSAVRANAQYDSAAALIAIKDWDGAIKTLEDFRTRFPNHALQPEVTDPATTKANGLAKPVTPLEKPTPRKPSPTVTPAPVAVSADGEDISDLI